MQRSITYQNPLAPFIYGVLFLLYTALCGIYLFLPPLLGLVYFYFSRALKREDSALLVLVLLALLLFETANGYILFSTLIYFYLLHRYIMPKIAQNLSCSACIRAISVLLVYLGFFLFYSLLATIFVLQAPSISGYVLYYIVIEFLLLSIL